jgi:hypothetical protein
MHSLRFPTHLHPFLFFVRLVLSPLPLASMTLFPLRRRPLDSHPPSPFGAAFASLSQLLSCFYSFRMRFADRWSFLFVEGVYGLPLAPLLRQSAASARCALVFRFKHNWRRLKQASNSCEGKLERMPFGIGIGIGMLSCYDRHAVQRPLAVDEDQHQCNCAAGPRRNNKTDDECQRATARIDVAFGCSSFSLVFFPIIFSLVFFRQLIYIASLEASTTNVH